MNEISTSSSSGSGAARSTPDRTVRHGLIEDWRDAVGILSLLLLAAFLGALIARLWPDDDVTHIPADLNTRISSLEQRLSQSKSAPDIAALQDRVAKIETRLHNTELALTAGGLAGTGAAGVGAFGPPGTVNPFGPSDGTRKLTEELATRLAAIESKTATAPADIQSAKDSVGVLTTNVTELMTKIDAMGTRLAHIESSDLISLARRASIASAVANLARAAQGSTPFKIEFDAVSSLIPGEPALAEIAPIAARGIPTAGTLIATFGNAGDAAVDAENIARGANWWSRLWAHFAALINARPVGEVTGDTTQGRIARAELRMKSGGDLAAAVKELAPIGGPARAPLQLWLNDAMARVKLEKMLAALNTRAAAELAGNNREDPATPVPQMPAP